MRTKRSASRQLGSARKQFGRSVAAVIALLLLRAVQATASEGYISLYYSVEGIGESSYTLSHSAGASEGLDDQDTIWYFIACVSCKTDTRAVSSADGEDLKIDTRPLDSESGVSVSCSMVSKSGDPITVTNAAQWVDVYLYGFDGYDVAVNGCDARKVSRIDLSPVTGTFSSGATLETLNISFTKGSGGDDPNDPSGPTTGPDPDDGQESARDTLFITNAIEGCSQTQTGVWTLVHARGALDAMDANDALHARPPATNFNSLIVSALSEPASGQRHLLAVDARPADSVGDIDLLVGVESESGQPVRFASPTANKLIFRFPTGAKDCFAGKPITFQQYDPTNPALAYPVWDVRRMIEKNQGLLPLADLREYRSSGVPYLCARVSTSRKPGDVLRDGRIDANDYGRIALHQGLTGPADTDIAGPKGLGLPDGAVDAWDLHALYQLLSDAEKGAVTPPVLPVLAEGFETGKLDTLNWYSLQWTRWFVTPDESHSGTYSVRAGRIGDDEITSLSLTLDCTAGAIRFWRRVSCERTWDCYRFYIDNRLQETLSGEVPWSEVSFPVEPGVRTFRWEYEKDDAISGGQDTVYLDDLSLPAVP